MNKLSLALVAGAVCIAASPVSAQVYVNNTPPMQAQVMVGSGPPGLLAGPHGPGYGYGRGYRNDGLIWTGVAMFGVSYAASVIGGAAVNSTCDSNNCDYALGGHNWLFVPLVGPFVAMGDVQGTNAGQTLARVLLAADGVLQVGGVTMAVLGFVLNSNDHGQVLSDRRVRFTPFATGAASGLAAFGRF